jgi:adenosylcobinamide-GDP ribazoletransferase
VSGEYGRGRAADGVRLAVTTLTVVPVRHGVIDRPAASVAMSVAPAVGTGLGLVVAAVGMAATALGASSLVASVLTIGAGVVLTRGLHLDGLADTADGLGSYRDAETALAIMRKPDVGPFGAAAIVLVLMAQIASATVLLTRPWLAAVAGIVAATATGRLAVAFACRRGIPAARSDGLGALVAGTVGPLPLIVGCLAVGATAALAVPGRPWQGPLAVAVSLGLVALLVRHVVRRLGGVTGDVLGAVCELATVVIYVVTSM